MKIQPLTTALGAEIVDVDINNFFATRASHPMINWPSQSDLAQ